MSIARNLLQDIRKLKIGVNEARSKTPSFIDETGDGFFAVKIDGLPEINSFRRQVEYKKQIADFKEKAKKGYADTKRKSYKTGVRKFIRDYGAKQYYCYSPNRPWEHDDSLEVYYISDEDD